MLTFLVWIIFGALIGALAAQVKGFSMVTGVLGGMFFGVLSPLMFLISGTHRKCPACAEQIKKEARLCPHCKTEVVNAAK
jgi:phosphotransferase system  glucose/maltose/N-acetylglucosamine-specific IIC component